MNVFNVQDCAQHDSYVAAPLWPCCNVHAVAAQHMRSLQSLHHSMAARWPKLAHFDVKTLSRYCARQTWKACEECHKIWLQGKMAACLAKVVQLLQLFGQEVWKEQITKQQLI